MPWVSTGSFVNPTARASRPSSPPASALASREPRSRKPIPTNARRISFAASTQMPSDAVEEAANPIVAVSVAIAAIQPTQAAAERTSSIERRARSTATTTAERAPRPIQGQAEGVCARVISPPICDRRPSTTSGTAHRPCRTSGVPDHVREPQARVVPGHARRVRVKPPAGRVPGGRACRGEAGSGGGQGGVVDERAPGPNAKERFVEVAEDDDAVTAERPNPERQVGAEDADVDRADQRRAEGKDARPVIDRDAAGAKVGARGPGREQRDEHKENEDARSSGGSHRSPPPRLRQPRPGRLARAGGERGRSSRRPCPGG